MFSDWQYQREKRIVFIFFIFIILLISIFLRLSNIQVFKSDELKTMVAKQYEKEIDLDVVSSDETTSLWRGNFYDRNGLSLLDSTKEDRVIVFPSLTNDIFTTTFSLAKALKQPIKEVEDLLANGPVILPYTVTEKAVKEIQELDLEGIIITPVSMRYAPNPLAVNLIGHLHEGEGLLGLEKNYNQRLVGIKGERAVAAQINAKGELISYKGFEIKAENDPNRRHVRLTIDSRIQTIVENVMDEKLKQGAVVVMNTASGDILASATRPTYNPVTTEKVSDSIDDSYPLYLDQTIQYSAPGSVFKVLLTVAAIEEEIADPDTIFECEEGYFECEHGKLTLAEALARSCNNTFAQIALQLGRERIISYAEKFKLDSQTIIGDPELNLRISSGKRGYSLIDVLQEDNLVQASIGQGMVEVSPLQISSMTNTIANGGIYREPRIVQELIDSEGKNFAQYNMSKGEEVISFSTAEKVHDMLMGVTLFGTGEEAYIEDYGSAGKTGTAQVPWGTDRWFTGYAPVDKPRIVITVLLNEGNKENPDLAKIIFREIMEEILLL